MALTPEQRKYIQDTYGVTPGSARTQAPAAPVEDIGLKEVQRLRALDASSRLAENSKKAVEKPKSVLDKIFSTTEKIGDVATSFGPTQSLSKLGGKYLLGAAESAAELIEGGKIPQEQKAGFDVMSSTEESAPSLTDTAMAALEVYPGGGYLSKALRKLPAGEQIAATLSKLPKKMKADAIKQYADVFRATSKESQALADEVVPELMSRKVTVTSPGALADVAETKATDFKGQIDKYFENLPDETKEATRPILDKLSKLKDKYIVDGKNIRPEAVKAIENVEDTISQFGEEISTKSVRKIRQIFDEHFDIAKGLDDLTAYKKKAERAGANAIREEFAKTRPDLTKLNKEYTLWTRVKDLSEYAERKATNRLSKGGHSIAGALLLGTQGNDVGSAVGLGTLGGFLGSKAYDMFKSPAWKTISATQKSRLADAMMKGDFNTVYTIVSKIIPITKNEFDSLLSEE